MGTPVNSRRRILSREMSEDEDVMMMIKEADAKFIARKASFAEAKEACVRKLVQQQQEIEELMEKQGADQNTQEDFKDKYMDAVESIGHLETEKVLLMYEVERLRDALEGTEEELAELHWKHTQINRELETEKVAKCMLLQKINCLKDQLEERKMSEAIERAATENMDQGIQSNLQHEEYSGAKKMGLKSDNYGKNDAPKLQGSTANHADLEQKHLQNSNFETKYNVQHKTKIPEEISNGKHTERSVNTFTQSTDNMRVKESARLIKAGENVTVAVKVNPVHQCETEGSKSNQVMEGSGNETLEPVKLGSEGKDSEYKETKAPKRREEEELTFEVSKVALEETVHSEKQSEGESGARQQVACDDSLRNTMEEEVRKQIEQNKTIRMEVQDGKNLDVLKGESTEFCGNIMGVLGQGELKQDHGVTPGEPSWDGTKERNREAISSDACYKELEMNCKAEEVESGGGDSLDGVGSARNKWMESGRGGEEATNLFQCMKETIPDFVKDGVSANPVKNQEMEGWLHSSIDKINKEACSRRKGGANTNEKARLGLLQEDNRDEEMNEMNIDLDVRGHKTVTGGSVQVEEKRAHNDSSIEENNGGREKGPFEMIVQMIKTIMPQKSLAKREGEMSSKDNIDGNRIEMHGDGEEEIKEQNEQHVPANQGRYMGLEKNGLESPGDGYEEKRDNDLSGKGLVKSVLKLTQPEESKAAREVVEEVEGIVDDPSDEEMHDAAESIAPEVKTTVCAEERTPDTEEDPENAPNNEAMEFGQSLNRSESTRRQIKNNDVCLVS